MKKSSKKKKSKIIKEIVEELKKLDRRKKTGNLKIGMMKFLTLAVYLLTRITLVLISSSAIIDCFEKVNFQGFNLVLQKF